MIPPTIDFHPAAIKEARQAYRWYLRRSDSAARRFQAAFEAALVQIDEAPQRWPVYLHGTHFRLLRRFPYVVVYRVVGRGPEILAVAHTGRKPGYWKRRQ